MRSPSDPGLQKQTSTVSMVNNKFPPTTVWRNCLGRVLKRANQTWSGCLIITQQFNLKSFTPFPPKHSAGHHFSASAIFVLLARVSRRMDKEGAKGEERPPPPNPGFTLTWPTEWLGYFYYLCLSTTLAPHFMGEHWPNKQFPCNFSVLIHAASEPAYFGPGGIICSNSITIHSTDFIESFAGGGCDGLHNYRR